MIYDKSKHGLGVRQDKPETDRVHHIDPADALETSGSPCLRFAIIDKHGLVEGPSDWDIEGHGLPFCGQNARLGLPFPRLPSVQQMNESPVCIFEENVALSVSETGFPYSSGVLCAWFLVCPIIKNTITKTSFLLHSFEVSWT